MKLKQKLAIQYIRSTLHLTELVSSRKAARKAFNLFCRPMSKPVKKPNSIFQNGAPLDFPLGSLTIRGHHWSPQIKTAGNRSKVLILHGFESRSSNFDQYLAPLLEHDLEVLAFDAPAHGYSGGKKINLPLYVETIRAIVDRYGPVDRFIGHSMGGLAVIHYLESIKHSSTCKVVLIAPATESKTSIDLFFRYWGLSGKTRQEFDQLIHDKTGRAAEEFSIFRAMAGIQAAICWFHDIDDSAAPIGDAQLVARVHPQQIEFIQTQGLGHRKIYRDPDVMEKSILFLCQKKNNHEKETPPKE